MTDKTLEEQQIDLEVEQTEEGIKRYRRELDKAKDKRQEATLSPQHSLLLSAIPKVSEGITKAKERDVKGGPKPKALSLIEDLDPDAVAFTVCHEVINAISQGMNTLEAEMGIARGVNDYRMMQEFKTKHQGLYTYALNKTNSGDQRYKRNAMRHYANYAGIENPSNKRNNILLGVWLLNLFVTETGLVEKKNFYVRGKIKQVLIATPQIMDWLQEKHNKTEVLSPFYLPMIVPPYEWSNGYDGGYRTHVVPLIKGQTKSYLEEINDTHYMDRVYKAVNAVQNTAYKVNVDVLDVVNYYWEKGIECESKVLPPRDYRDIPDMPCERTEEAIAKYKKTNEAEWLAWKSSATFLHTMNNRENSKRATLITKLYMANKFKDYEQLFFCSNVDFRGRVYPLVPFLNPQSDDLGKALLEFAHPVPLGEHGDKWLKVHLANSYGEDKVSIDDRVKWTESKEIAILMVADDPLATRSFWETAGSPWQFLAGCMEYARYKRSGLGKDFESVIPVGLDGSCNGLQHFSAMFKDKHGGSQVNLVPSDVPADVYQEVADVVEAKLKAETDVTYAQFWIGKISRKLVKRQVMTLPYGSTEYGMRDQLKEELKSQKDSGNDILKIDDQKLEWKVVLYLTKLIWQSINEVLEGSVVAMDWLKGIAKEANKEGLGLTWTTPVGFPVNQFYKKTQLKEIDTTFMKLRIRRNMHPRIDKIDGRKQVSAVSPNVVHSLDASHMMSTVNRCLDLGIKDFSMVHDSFAVHVGHVQTLSEQLRLTFIEQYKGDFAGSLQQQFEETLKIPLPEVPPRGDLDITRVMESDYFFN
jgi:DNA-directed RNA polymerase